MGSMTDEKRRDYPRDTAALVKRLHQEAAAARSALASEIFAHPGLRAVQSAILTMTGLLEEAASALRSEKSQSEVRDAALEEAAAIAIRRTEIPRGARNPTRDQVVIVGEEIAAIIRDRKTKK